MISKFELLIFVFFSLIVPLHLINNEISVGDVYLVKHANLETNRQLSSIDPNNFGFLIVATPSLIPSYFFLSSILSTMHLNHLLFHFLTFIELFLRMYSIFFLISVIDKSISSQIKIICALFYAYGFYFMITPLYFNINLIWCIAPLFAGVLLLYFKSHRIFSNYIIYLALLSVVFAASSVNPAVYLAFFLFCMLFTILVFFIEKPNIPSFLLKIMLIILLLVAINLYWLSSFFSLTNNEIVANVDGSWAEWTSATSTYLNVLRGQGSWAFQLKAFGSSHYVSYSSAYSTSEMTIISFIFIFLLLIGYSFKQKNTSFHKPYYAGSLFLFIVFISLTVGPHFLLYDDIIKNIPFFWVFRNPYTRFIPASLIFMSVSLAYSISFINDWIKKRFKGFVSAIFLVFISVCIMLYSFPYVTGEFIASDRGIVPGGKLQTPSYWYELSSYVNSRIETGKILLLPQSPFYQVHYFWWLDGYYGVDPVRSFVFIPIVSLSPGGGYVNAPNSDETIKLFYDNYLNNNSFNSNNYLSLFGVKYILHRKDLDWTHIGTANVGEPKVIQDRIAASNLVENKKSFGVFNTDKIETDQYFSNKILPKFSYLLNDSVIDVYQVKSTYMLPYFYIPQEIIISNLNLTALPDIVSQTDYQIRSAIYFENQNNPKLTQKIIDVQKQQNNSQDNGPTIEFHKISPAKYRIRLHNASNNVLLVFLQSFHKGWEVYLRPYSYDVNSSLLSSYKQFDAYAPDQVNLNDLRNLIDSGFVSTLGDGKEKVIEQRQLMKEGAVSYPIERYTVSFISKESYGTIQNDNLPDGAILETLFEKPIIGDDNHLLVNGYANSWIIDTDRICLENDKCKKNPNGTYDFELVAEFSQQKIFFISSIISVTSFIFCICYLIYDWRKTKHSPSKS